MRARHVGGKGLFEALGGQGAFVGQDSGVVDQAINRVLGQFVADLGDMLEVGDIEAHHRDARVAGLGADGFRGGFTAQGASNSDKSTGVVGLVALDLRRRGKVNRIGMCGTDGRKLPAIRAHMQRVLGAVYSGIDPSTIETWPKDGVVDRESYKAAVAAFFASQEAPPPKKRRTDDDAIGDGEDALRLKNLHSR